MFWESEWAAKPRGEWGGSNGLCHSFARSPNKTTSYAGNVLVTFNSGQCKIQRKTITITITITIMIMITIHLYESTQQKNDIHKKYLTRSTSSTITVLNSWTRVENRLISGLEYVLLLRMSCLLRSNHHSCHQATAFSSSSYKNSSNRKIESAGGRWEEGEASLPLFLLPIVPRASNFSLSLGSLSWFPTTQRGFCQ